MRVKKLAVLSAAAIAFIGLGMGVSQAPAFAASCPGHQGGNLCAVVVSDGGDGVATVRGYALNSPFTGYFKLETANGRVYKSISATWHAGGTGNYFNNIDGGIGDWCMVEYTQIEDGSYTPSGTACFGI
jgi:hypothetical protein